MTSLSQTLCVRQENGRYRPATTEEVVNVAALYMEAPLRSMDVMTCPEDTESYLRARLANKVQEVFACLFLDNRHRVIEYSELFRGTVDGCSVHPREVVREALRCNAAAVIFAHNHPSGVAEPSQADIRITERLRDALQLIDVRTLDHIVVGDECTSLAKRRLI